MFLLKYVRNKDTNFKNVFETKVFCVFLYREQSISLFLLKVASLKNIFLILLSSILKVWHYNNNNNNNFICTNIIYNTKIKTMQIKNKEHQETKTTYGIL